MRSSTARTVLRQGAFVIICASATFARKLYPEEIHNPNRFKAHITSFVNDTDYQINRLDTPDWRVEEDIPVPFEGGWRHEEERPYRLSPFEKQDKRWQKSVGSFRTQPDRIWTTGCYCCTVFKRLTPLATCAVITTRHILTTATSTELVLKEYGKRPTLENILGAWYDRTGDVMNSSMYMTPCRIHYHPRYNMPENVNSSHPIPCVFDLAVWAATYPFVGTFWSGPWAYICERAGCHWLERGTPTPLKKDNRHMMLMVGFQYMWYYKKVPMPWFKYVIKTKKVVDPCPKTEWGWFFCIDGRSALLGIDSGCALHRSNQRYGWMNDGLLAMGAFSMTLRHKILTHYFTPVENYVVLEWLYAAYKGRGKYRYLDGRFYDSKGRAPLPKPWYYIPWRYPEGENNAYDDPPLWNK